MWLNINHLATIVVNAKHLTSFNLITNEQNGDRIVVLFLIFNIFTLLTGVSVCLCVFVCISVPLRQC